MRTAVFAVMVCVLAAASDAMGQSITLKTNSVKTSTSKNGSPPGPVTTLDAYKSEPSGNYDTGTNTGTHRVVLELGTNQTTATFTPTNPRTYPTDYATGAPQSSFSTALSGAVTP